MHCSFLFRAGCCLCLLSCGAVVKARAETTPSIAATLQPFVDGHLLAGAVTLVATPEKILTVEAVGWMDVAARKPMRTDGLFWIASQSKPITAAALMTLVDAGKVKVDDPIEKYLPEFKDRWVKIPGTSDQLILARPHRLVLVRDLLSHTSGLPFKSAIEEPTLDRFPLGTRVVSYSMQPLEFEPGSKFLYSNAGINTIGRLIEVLSGMPLDQFLDQRIFRPLGMSDTTFWPSTAQLERLAKSYKPVGEGLEECPITQLQYPLDDRERQPMPAGGLFSTARDLAAFYQMLANDGEFEGRRILSAESVRQMTMDQTGELHSAYGFGMGTDGKSFTHGGAYNTNSRYDRQSRLITVFLVQHAGWGKGGEKIAAAFQKVARANYGQAGAASENSEAHLVIGIPSDSSDPARMPFVQTADKQNAVVFQEPGRYGGWPANHGMWAWGNELVVGFKAAWYKPATNDHAVDRNKPFETWQARSLDGGLTWTTERPAVLARPADARHLPLLEAPLDFQKEGFALMFQYASQEVGPSWFFVSDDKCRTWRGPYALQVEGIDQIAARTDLVVLGQKTCLMFGSAAKKNGREGRPFCARTDDGGRVWKLVSLIGPEPAGFAIMPSTQRLKSGALLTMIRRSDPGVSGFIEAWRSDDEGGHWRLVGKPAADIGGNPPSLVTLPEGRLALIYGHRTKPFGILARTSEDDGNTWGPEIVLRDDGLTGDLGYPRSIVRADGKIVSTYYFNGPRDEDRTIQATIWSPPPAGSKPAAVVGLTAIDRVRIFPAAGRESAVVGARIVGSNESATQGFQTLAEIRETRVPAAWIEVHLADPRPYRWIRYEAPPGSHGNLAELEFYSGETKVNGAGFGTPGSLAPGGHWKTVFDRKTGTWFNSERADGQFVGLDFGDQASVGRPSFSPTPGDFDRAQTVTIGCRTPGATIRYTLDGTTPDARGGQIYREPLQFTANTNLVAVAFKDGIACSPATYGTYWVGPQATQPLRSFHIGNSLTGNASKLPVFYRTAGVGEFFDMFLVGGATTAQIWRAKETSDREQWADSWGKISGPLNYFTLQPRDFNVAQEADYDARFIREIEAKSPDAQPWLYAEWEEFGRNRPTDRGEVPSSQMKKTFPAPTWEEGMSAMLLYNEEVQLQLKQMNLPGKVPRIIPTALALGWARNLIDEGKFPEVPPGEKNFYATLFEDHVHMNMSGCYLVALTWYAAVHRESPEGRVQPIGTALSNEQAKVLQRLAWEMIRNYPDCGLYEPGASPCAPPEFTTGAKRSDGLIPIHLGSRTPGAWFRYTLDGTTPSRTRGYVYCGVITAQPGITLKAVAFQSGMADSPVTQMEPAGGTAN